MLVVRLDEERTIIVHNAENNTDTIEAYSYAARQHDAKRVVIVADCTQEKQMDALHTILHETKHWRTFVSYVANEQRANKAAQQALQGGD